MRKNILLALCISLLSIQISSEYVVNRIDDSSLQAAVTAEKTDVSMRKLKKYGVIGGAALSVCAIYYLNQHLFPINESGCKCFTSAPVVKTNVQDSTAISQIGSMVALPFVTVGKWAIGHAPSFLGSLILNNGYSSGMQFWTYFDKVEKLPGFVSLNTKIADAFSILKETSIPFDIYSKRLSLDINFGQHKVAIERFVQDATDIIAHDAHAMKFYLSQMLRNNYTKHASELDALQSYSLKALTIQQKHENGLFEAILYDEKVDKQTLCDFSNLLVLEVQRVIAFCKVKIEGSHLEKFCEENLAHMTNQVNNFAQEVEQKLNLSTDQLYEQSKAGNGIFDLIYDYHDLFYRDIKTFEGRLKFV